MTNYNDISPKDVLICRQTALKAAVETHARIEGFTNAEESSELVLGMAALFETWLLRSEGFGEALHALTVAQVAGLDGPQNENVATPPVQKAAVAARTVGGFDIHKCPRHPKATGESKFGGLFCKNPECDWAEKEFINEDPDTMEKYVVVKYKLDGAWHTEPQLRAAVAAQ